jgi:MoxR-like ATPase
MEERQVTADGASLALPEAFFVMATQNPVEQQGVYPLPEAQLDRFAMRLSVGYPTPDEEELLVSHRASSNLRLPPLPAVTSIEDIHKAQEVVDKIHVDQTVVEYMVKLVLATRQHSDVVLGASPRASLALCKCAQALAAVRGSDFVTPDLIKAIAIPTLAHRLVMEPRALVTGRTAQAVVEDILKSIPVPLGL